MNQPAKVMLKGWVVRWSSQGQNAQLWIAQEHERHELDAAMALATETKRTIVDKSCVRLAWVGDNSQELESHPVQ